MSINFKTKLFVVTLTISTLVAALTPVASACMSTGTTC